MGNPTEATAFDMQGQEKQSTPEAATEAVDVQAAIARIDSIPETIIENQEYKDRIDRLFNLKKLILNAQDKQAGLYDNDSVAAQVTAGTYDAAIKRSLAEIDRIFEEFGLETPSIPDNTQESYSEDYVVENNNPSLGAETSKETREGQGPYSKLTNSLIRILIILEKTEITPEIEKEYQELTELKNVYSAAVDDGLSLLRKTESFEHTEEDNSYLTSEYSDLIENAETTIDRLEEALDKKMISVETARQTDSLPEVAKPELNPNEDMEAPFEESTSKIPLEELGDAGAAGDVVGAMSEEDASLPAIETKELEYTETDLEAYRAARGEWLTSKGLYSKAQLEYQAALRRYNEDYSEKGIIGRAIQAGTKYFSESGLQKELKDKKEAFRSARLENAKQLQRVMSLRADVHEEYNDFDKTNHDTKVAFARKFITKPLAEELTINQESLKSTKSIEMSRRVMAKLGKHKWAVRIGSVTLTGIGAGLAAGSGVALAAGGAAAALKALRVAGGVAGGIGGAKAGNWLGEKLTKDSDAQIASAEQTIQSNFNVESIDVLEKILTDANQSKENRENARKALTAIGAIVGGAGLAGLAGFSDSAEAATASASENINPIKPIAASTPDTTPTPANDAVGGEATISPEAPPKTTGVPTETPVEVNITAPAESLTEASPTEVNITAPAESLLEADPLIHTVEKGDTLWAITKDTFGEKLSHLNNAEKNLILREVFVDAQKNPELLKELGVSSGNINLIYPDEKLNLEAIDSLVDDKVAALKAGTLTVEKVSATAASEALRTENFKAPHMVPVENMSPTDIRHISQSPYESPVKETILTSVKDINHSPNFAPVENMSPTGQESIGRIYGEDGIERTIKTTDYGPGHTRTEISEVGPNSVNYEHSETKITDTRSGGGQKFGPVPDYRSAEPAPVEGSVRTDMELVRISHKLDLPTPLTQSVIDEFGSVEAFKAVKIAAIEDIAGPQPSSWFGGEKFEPVFEKIKTIPLEGTVLPNGVKIPGIAELANTGTGQRIAYLNLLGMDQSASNLTALNNWVAHYQEMTASTSRNGFGLTHTPNTTYNELFTKYILAVKK